MNTIKNRFCLVLPTLLFTFVILSTQTAHAAKLMATMTPDNLPNSGFTMKAVSQKDGTIAFTLTRDLSKARSFEPESELEIRRSATLQIFGKSGLIARCRVEPHTEKNIITYSFVIAKDSIADSTFTLSDIDDYKDKRKPSLIGGGEILEFKLALFAPTP